MYVKEEVEGLYKQPVWNVEPRVKISNSGLQQHEVLTASPSVRSFHHYLVRKMSLRHPDAYYFWTVDENVWEQWRGKTRPGL